MPNIFKLQKSCFLEKVILALQNFSIFSIKDVCGTLQYYMQNYRSAYKMKRYISEMAKPFCVKNVKFGVNRFVNRVFVFQEMSNK